MPIARLEADSVPNRRSRPLGWATCSVAGPRSRSSLSATEPAAMNHSSSARHGWSTRETVTAALRQTSALAHAYVPRLYTGSRISKDWSRAASRASCTATCFGESWTPMVGLPFRHCLNHSKSSLSVLVAGSKSRPTSGAPTNWYCHPVTLRSGSELCRSCRGIKADSPRR